MAPPQFFQEVVTSHSHSQTRIKRQPENLSGSQTFHRRSADTPQPERTPYDREGKGVIDLGLLSLILMLIVPAVAPLVGAAAVVRGFRAHSAPGQDIRASIGIALGAAAALCGLMFWLMWIFLRPSPRALALGWAGLRRLPAVPAGFQHTRQDPFGFSLSSWHAPDARP